MLHPFAPYDAAWHEAVADDAWIVARRDDIERVYTRLWQEAQMTSVAVVSLDIVVFARYLSSQKREES